MADVNISKYSTQIVREGSKPAAPGFVVSEGQDPVNPPGTNNYVPYTGATANVELGEYGLESGFVTLDTTPTNTPADQGTIYWDDSRSTAALIMNGTLQHIGQDTFFYVKNSTGSNIAKGTAVRFAGTDGASGHLLIAPFLANGTYPSNYFMGVTAEAIANGSFGQVMHFGELQGVNTSGYTAGDLLYASTSVAGAFQTTAPVAPNNIVLVAAAINSTNNGTILVRPTYGSNINQDEGVKITTPTTGDLLQLQAGGLWENKTKAQILGGTSSQFVKGDGSLDSTSYQPLLTNPVTGTGTTNYLPKFTGSTTIGNSVIADNASEINIPKRIFLNSGSESIFLTPNLSSASNRIEGSSGVPLEITTGGSSLKFAAGGTTPQFTLASSGAATFTGSVTASSIIKSGGTSTQYLMADGSVSTLTNPVTGTGTTNYLPKFTGTSTIGNSNIQDSGTLVSVGVAATFSSSVTATTATLSNTVAITLTASDSRIVGGNSTGRLLLANSGTTTFGIFHGASHATLPNAIQFYNDNTASLTIPSNGNLLVGTTTDAGYKLDVNGTGRVTQNLTIGAATAATNVKLIFNGVASKAAGIEFHQSGTPQWYIGNGIASEDNNFELYNSNGTMAMKIIKSTNAINFIGAATFSSSVQSTGLLYRIQAAGTDGYIAYLTSGVQNTVMGFNNSGSTNAQGVLNNHSYFGNLNAYGLQFTTNGAVVATITSSGNVGIGTSSPSDFAALTLVKNGASNYSAVACGNSNSTATLFVGVGGSSVSNTALRNNAYLLNASNSDLIFGTNDTERMRITSGGNVLIGTTTDSGYKLDVNGVTRSSISYKIGTYTQGTTTPSVSNVSFMIISNSSSTTISNFTNAVDGQILTLLFTDSNTTINRVNAYLLNGANYTSGPNDTIKLIYSSGLWYEISRSSNA